MRQILKGQIQPILSTLGTVMRIHTTKPTSDGLNEHLAVKLLLSPSEAQSTYTSFGDLDVHKINLLSLR